MKDIDILCHQTERSIVRDHLFVRITSKISMIFIAFMVFVIGYLLSVTYAKNRKDGVNKQKLISSKEKMALVKEADELNECSEHSKRKSKLAASLYFQRKKDSKCVYFTFIPKVKSRFP